MQNITIYLIALFLVQFAVAQNAKTITGKVVFNQNGDRDVEVINWNKKTITISDTKGIFTIYASEKDSLFFLSKNHLDRKINVSKSIYESATVTVQLVEKTEDLEEVQIIQNQSFKYKFDENSFQGAKRTREATQINNPAIYKGTIDNGMDFVAIFRLIKGVFKNKNKESNKEIEVLNFKKFVAANFDTEFFVKNLDLKPYNIPVFIAFCNADEEAAQAAVQHSNILTVIDYLQKKRASFDKL